MIELPRGLTQEGARGLKFDFHIREAKLQPLELVDGFPKRLALGHILQRGAEAGLCGAERAGRDIQAPAIQTLHGVFETMALFAHKIACRNAAVVELDLCGGLALPAHLVLKPAKGQTRRAILDIDGGDALGTIFARAHHADIGIGIAAAGDERFGAIQHIALVIAGGAGLE